MSRYSSVTRVFLECDAAVRNGVLIHRTSRQDKEFHFQDWFRARLNVLSIKYDPPARNSYPDFRLVRGAEGYEIKGLAYPGREATYDSNSQVPTGLHNGRTIWYLFGRYPRDVDGDDYPVIDFVLCHGDFLNADHAYVHKNKSVRGFGSYGDIMIRDRKMYVSPTPFALLEGATSHRTLILPKGTPLNNDIELVAELQRTEAAKLVIGYSFDLRTNQLVPKYEDNPHAGTVHSFIACRVKGSGGPEVRMRQLAQVLTEMPDEEQ